METTIKSLVTKTDLLSLKSNLSKEISELKADVFKWMFIFAIAQVAVTFLIISSLLKK